MPLVTCPDCDAQISDAAPTCPQCGRPMTAAPSAIPFGDAKSRKQGCLAVVGVLAALLGLGVCSLSRKADQAKNAPAPTAPAYMAVDLGELLHEYEDNELRADSKFKGRLIRLEGVASGISKDITGDAYVKVGTSAAFEIPSVQCFLTPSATSRAANLSKGDLVQVRGKVRGLMMNVLISECELAP